MSGIVGQDPRGRSGIVNQFTDVGVNTALDSEWHSSMNAIQINSGSLSAHDSYPHYVQLNANVIQKDSGEKRLDTSYKASQHRQWDGTHIFKVAPAASGDISWTTAMTINNDGDIYSTGWTSWTPTVAGFSGTPTVLGKYKRIGKLVYVMFSVEGTSDSGTLYVTNMPVAPYATGDYHQALAVGFCQDNSANTGLGTANILAGNGYCYCRKGGAYDGWTASGTKNILVSGVYEANAI